MIPPRPEYLRRLSASALPWVFLAALVLLGLGVGMRDPWPADEPRFVLNALEMIETGDWLIPHRGGEPYPDKPPVYLWATAASIAATGSVRLGFLLPSLLAAMGTLLLIVDLVRRLHGGRIAVLAGLALLSTVQFVLQAKSAQIDMLVTFWITLGTYGLMRHALLGPARHWWLIGCMAMGLGVITKGVGFLPLLMVPVWLVLARRGAAVPLGMRDLLAGLAVMLAAIAVWVVPMIIATTASGDPTLIAYRDEILLRQTAGRYVDPWHHYRPWHYYTLEVLTWAWLPLLLALPWAAPNWWRRLRRRDARTILPLSGVVLILLFFTLSPAKRGVYMLPTVPLLVLAMAPLLPGLLARPGLHRLATGMLAFLAGLFVLAAVLGWAGFDALTRLATRYEAEPWLWWALLGGSGIALLAWLRPNRGMVALSAWLAVFWLLWSLFLYPDLDGVRSPRDMMAEVVGITGAGSWLALPDFGEEFMLHARQPTVHFGYHTPTARQLERAYAWMADTPGSRWMLIAHDHETLLNCVDMQQAYDLGFQNSQDWWLIPGVATRECRGDATSAEVYVVPTSLQPSRFLP